MKYLKTFEEFVNEDIINEAKDKMIPEWEMMTRFYKEMKKKHEEIKLNDSTFEEIKSAIKKAGVNKLAFKEITGASKFNKKLQKDVERGWGVGAYTYMIEGGSLVAAFSKKAYDGYLEYHQDFGKEHMPFSMEEIMYKLRPNWFTESLYVITPGEDPSGYRGDSTRLGYVKAITKKDAEVKFGKSYVDAHLVPKKEIAKMIKQHQSTIKQEEELLKQLNNLK